jgi:hypothetical protein
VRVGGIGRKVVTASATGTETGTKRGTEIAAAAAESGIGEENAAKLFAIASIGSSSEW